MKKLILFIFLIGIMQLNAQDEKEEILINPVEQAPEFPGGIEELQKYLASNITYPKKARLNKEEGTVYITFIVDKSGAIRDAKILRGVSPILDKEAIRVVSKMPDWKPGMQEGEVVNVQYNIPIKFSL